jgi:outer membrane lipoprotein-sorting protein
MRRAIILGLSVLLLRMASAQTQPDLMAVLKKVGEIYKAATQYEFVGDGTCHVRKTGAVETFHMLIAFKAPNRYRMQAATPCLGPGEPDLGEPLMVHDGSVLWAYFPGMNLYTSMPASALTADASGDMGDVRPENVDLFTMWRQRGIADVAGQATFVREEAMNFAGAKVTCYVVVVPPQEHLPAQTWWIDKTNYHILRMDDDNSSVVFTSVKLNEPLSDELFKFTPPADARKVEMDK